MPEPKHVRGDILTPLAMSMLIAGNYEQLEGPMGQVFLQAIRLRWSSQLGPDASVERLPRAFKSMMEMRCPEPSIQLRARCSRF